ncbi:hypothetical protein PCL_02796 [Purpureocillium lilacinum]|uniref:Uncharacterized protein n=1 Tax=Purpureocillium lilacinum TaxID=33203 RepID=A0A2U3DNV0_PURLI|nr:hypothetical protein PCL_02796 [Purpureocillium lilacinum]
MLALDTTLTTRVLVLTLRGAASSPRSPPDRTPITDHAHVPAPNPLGCILNLIAFAFDPPGRQSPRDR